MRIEHDIFHEPHEVALTIEERPRPEVYARYTSAATMPMWRVQTEGYTEGADQLVGIVSRDQGFLDSPDTEWISSGVNSKNPDAVAIGRHGNFLLWGFAASPTYMTEEGKLVFVNALHYIARFAGQTPIARKRQGTMTRDSVRQALDAISEEGHARTVATYAAIAADIAQRKATIEARIAAGEEVSAGDRQMLEMKPPRTPGRFDGIERYCAEDVWPRIRNDEGAIRAHVTARLPFLRSEGWYRLAVDEELQRFGVGNDDIALLDRAVATWVAGEDVDLAQALLERYTDESFETAAEWATWLRENRDRLFFTEAGGYKWLVNARGAGAKAAAAAAEAGVTAAQQPAPMPELEPTAGRPLAAAMTVTPLADGRLAVSVRTKILAGWHAYDHLPAGSAYAPTTLELELPEGLQQATEWQRPSSAPYAAEPGITIFEGAGEFRCELTGAAPVSPTEIVCRLGYQVCDAQMCLPPTSDELRATIPAASRDSRDSRDGEFDELEAEYVAAVKQHLAATRAVYDSEEYRALRAANDNAGIRKLMAAYEHPGNAFAERFEALARARQGAAEARCLLWIVMNARDATRKRAAADGLTARHIDGPHTQAMVEAWTSLLSLREGAQEVLKAVIDGSKNADAVAEALWVVAYLGRDPEAQAATEKRIRAEYPGSTAALRYEGPTFERERLQVGMTAPDIVGEDTDGVTFKLSDYRGKVVLLDFWGDW